ncbi:hypothetical protein [Shewanella algae]|nr:hypothetical protein [Shewanella algae]
MLKGKQAFEHGIKRNLAGTMAPITAKKVARLAATMPSLLWR